MTRACSGCTLCCKLMPITSRKSEHFEETVETMIEHGLMTRADFHHMVRDFEKPAGERCPHQRTGKGCAIYNRRPFGCRFWSCRWLVADDTADLSRPDRSHYVIDISPDFVTDSETNTTIPVIQIWCDPKHPRAIDDPALRAYLDRRGKEGYAALIRYGASEGFVLFPPAITGGEWVENHPKTAAGPEHTMEEKLAALGDITVTIR